MACSSDEEKFEVESILEQRKRKGILQYLVQWKEGDSTWEPAESIAADCALAIETFLSKQKKKRSSSRTRKSSRSRSRSQSRSRKGDTKPVRRSTRSRSRGRSSKEAAKQPSTTVEKDKNENRKSPDKKATETESKVVSETKSSPLPSSSAAVKSSSISTSEKSESFCGRQLRSSTMESRKKLEVQRVHNEQRPVREDDNKPRSVIWKVADYAVIVLFIISIFAASFMFLEKFMDLENFKKQAFPNFETLTSRLHAAKDHLMDFVFFGWDRTSDAWDYILANVKQPPNEQPVSAQ